MQILIDKIMKTLAHPYARFAENNQAIWAESVKETVKLTEDEYNEIAYRQKGNEDRASTIVRIAMRRGGPAMAIKATDTLIAAIEDNIRFSEEWERNLMQA